MATTNTKVKIQKFSSLHILKDLPENLKISTITSTCLFDTLFDTAKIKEKTNLKIKNTKGGKQKQFDNQISISIPYDKTNLNFKLFKNGSIQVTGPKNFEDFWYGIEYLCKKLDKSKHIQNPENFKSDKIKEFNIRLINSDFKIGFKIDRYRLSAVLDQQQIKYAFDPEVHAGVIIKYNYKNINKVSIFVFESGSVIITGAKNMYQILGTYEYINRLLFKNYSKIVWVDLDEKIKLFLETKIFNM